MTVPMFVMVVPVGISRFSWARFTIGPLIRYGLVGSRPADGPGSVWFAGNVTVNELESTPAETMGVKLEYAVF